MKNYLDFTYCPLDIGLDNHTIEKIRIELTRIHDRFYTYDSYRNINILNPRINDQWSETFSQCKNTIRLFENILFRTFPSPTIRILKTVMGQKVNDHIDCKHNDIDKDSLIYSAKIVVSGNVDKFYFVTNDNTKKYIPSYARTYITNGHCLHGIDQDTDTRITIVFWTPMMTFNQTDEYLNLLDLANSFKLNISR